MVTPSRVIDTRSGIGTSARAVPAGGTISVKVTGVAGVPATGVSAVVINLVALSATRSGYITGYADGTSRPHASIINFSAGQTIDNEVVVPVGTDGKIALFNGAPSTVQLIGDLAGYYTSGTAGATWHPPVPIGITDLSSISCPTTDFCAVVSGGRNAGNLAGGEASAYHAGSWSSPTVLIDTGYVNSVDCLSASFCVAVGWGLNGMDAYFVWDGTAWSAPDTVPGGGGLVSVSCTSPTNCIAIDYHVGSYRYDGQSWTTTSLLDPLEQYTWSSLSCSSPTFCVAVGGSPAADDDSSPGYEVSKTFDGTNWSAPTTVFSYYGSGAGLTSVSCVSETFCVVAESQPNSGEGSEERYDGTSWSAIGPYDWQAWEVSISCVSTNNCVAVDVRGNALTLDGITNIDGTNVISSISCATDDFCMAVDAGGNAIQYS